MRKNVTNKTKRVICNLRKRGEKRTKIIKEIGLKKTKKIFLNIENNTIKIIKNNII